MELQLLAEGLEFPEGPIAMADGSVILTEIKAGRLTRVARDGTKSVVAETGGGPNGAGIGPDGAIWVANNGGSFRWIEQQGLTIPGPTPPEHRGGSIQRVEIASGKVEMIYDACDGRPLLGPNDLVFDSEGGFWFTDHGLGDEDGRRFGALLYATADGKTIRRARDHLISPNGVGLSPDEKTVYVADTYLARLWAFDVARPGELEPPPGFAPGRSVCNLQGVQYLDSLAVEAGGKVCVATILNGGITAFDPD
ncbi:MAG: SMP-30/gluconolactonase/LRE family protein, partial [Caulobacteraceae bacterium]